MKIKDVIGVLLIIAALIGMVVSSICAVVFNIQNPDMTELRLLIENPGPAIAAIICFVLFLVGRCILDD